MAANTCKATLCSPRCAGGDWPGKHAASTAGLFFPQRDHEYFTLLPAPPAGERYRGHCTQQRSHSQLTTSHSRMTEDGKNTGKKNKKTKTHKMPGGAPPRSKSTECTACLGNPPPPHHPHTPAPFPGGKSLSHSRFRSGSLPVPARPFLLLSKRGEIHVACLFNILLLDSILSP